MKLCFSTRGWHGYSWEDFRRMALEYGFSGIEIHNIRDGGLAGETGPVGRSAARATSRGLFEEGLSIPCIDALCDLGDPADPEGNIREVESCIQAARRVGVPYIRVRAANEGDQAGEAVAAALERLTPEAENQGVTLLLESRGPFARSEALRDMLNRFASDGLAALWDVHSTVRVAGEDPDTTVQNLGAYIRHVHLRDSRPDGEDWTYCLLGEGSLPMSDVMAALRSIGYKGFLALEWDPSWLSGLGPDVILPHFASRVERLLEADEPRQDLYWNNAHTGQFIWKKELLIQETFPQLLDRVTETFPDQYAFRFPTLDYTRTYREFRRDVDRFARALIDMGVRPGAHVAVWATNVPQWYIAFWAVTKIGAVFVSMNTAYKLAETEYLLRHSDAHTLIMVRSYRDSDYAGIIRELCPELEHTRSGSPLHSRRLPFLRNVITVGFRMAGCQTFEEAEARADRVPPEELLRRAAAVKPDDVCNMQYTSGTTGFPKGVMLTHRNVVNNGKCIGDRMDLSTADRMMIQVPMFHCFGMVLAMTASVTHCVTMLPLPYFSVRPALECIHRERVTCSHGVPDMFIALMEHPDFQKVDVSCIRTGIMAGSPCPEPVMREVVERMNMKEITIVYGQTEASPGCTMSRTDDSIDVRVTTVGRPLPEVECRIVDPETGEDCPDNVSGEFLARGYNVMKGYYKMPHATAAAIDKDGWLHTGDLACRTPEGNFRITGRLKDMIIRGGENIYPKEIEEFLYTHPKIADVQVVGVADEAMGEEIGACIILKEGETMTADEVKAFVRANMAKYKVPRYVDFMDEFPMNAAGKILKYKLREDLAAKYAAKN